MTTVVDSPIDYSERKTVHGDNRFTRISPIAGYSGASLQLAQSSSSDVTFELPAQVFNLSRSYLQFVIQVPAQTAANSITSVNSIPIDRMTLMTRSGITLVDIPNFWQYFLTTDPVCRPLRDYIQSDFPFAATSAAAATRSICGASPTSLQNLTPLTSLNNGGTAIQCFRFLVPLWRINQSLFALDKNLWMGGEILTMRVSFAAYDRFCYKATPATSDFATIQLQLPYLQLSIETNPDVRAQVMDMCNNGYSFKTPYPYVFKFGNVTSLTSNVRLNKGHASRLLRVYTTAFSAAETLAVAQTNIIPVDIRTLVDQQFMQDYNLTTIDNQDYLWMKDILIGSAIVNDNLRTAVPATGWWSYIDNFTKYRPVERQDDVEDGISLEQEKMYSAQMNCAASNVYHFAITQRTITIQRGLIQIV